MENDAGSARKEFSVEVVVKAKVEPNFDLVTVQTVGDTAQFDCMTSGTPPPRIIWEHNGRILDSESKSGIFFRHGGRSLVIDEVTLDWSGNLTCTAINDAGEEAFTTELEIFQEPFFNLVLNGSIEIIAGENLEIPCQE